MRSLIVICTMMCIISIHAQNTSIRQWQSITSMYDMRDAIQLENVVYAATKGGIFEYDINAKKGNEIRVENNGLLSSNCTAIGYDIHAGLMWIGAENGSIVLYNTRENIFTPITAIVSTNNVASKRIRSFSFTNDIAFVCGDFGIMKFSPKGIPEDWIARVGTLPTGSKITDIEILGDTVWVSTNNGIAKASIYTQLQLQNSWTVYTNFTNKDFIGLSIANSMVYAATNTAIQQYAAGTFTEQTIVGTGLNALSVKGNDIVYSTVNGVYMLGATQPISGTETIGAIQSHTTIGGNLVCFMKSGGMYYITPQTNELIKPNTPSNNNFTALGIDGNNNVWSCFEEGGIATIRDELWKNYGAKEVFNGSGYEKFIAVSTLNNGNVKLGNYGSGFAEGIVNEDTLRFISMPTSFRKVLGMNSGDFSIVGQAKEDRSGNIWLTRYSGDDAADIIIAGCKISKDSIIPFYDPISAKNQYSKLEIDNYNTKWLGSTAGLQGKGGIYYLNEKNTLYNRSDDVSGTVMDYKDIRVIKKDNVGILWIGSNDGLYAIYSTSSVASGKVPIVKTVTAMKDQSVNDVAIDAENNKWIATDKGVFVLNEDGTEIKESYTMQNAPFPSNKVNSIVIDRINGKVYCGTNEGLYIGFTNIVNPAYDYSSLKCFPQPFIPEEHGFITIEGLASETTISIVTPSGMMKVRTLQTKSGKVVWDGKDDSGQYVGNGVYLILAQSASSDQSGVAKCLVRRK